MCRKLREIWTVVFDTLERTDRQTDTLSATHRTPPEVQSIAPIDSRHGFSRLYCIVCICGVKRVSVMIAISLDASEQASFMH